MFPECLVRLFKGLRVYEHECRRQAHSRHEHQVSVAAIFARELLSKLELVADSFWVVLQMTIEFPQFVFLVFLSSIQSRRLTHLV